MEKALINEIIVGILRYSESSLIGLTSSKTCSLMIEASCHNICSSQNIVRNIYIYICIMTGISLNEFTFIPFT